MSTDKYIRTCTACNKKFGILRWRYSCEKCRQVFCDDCLQKSMLYHDEKIYDYDKCCPDCREQNNKEMSVFFEKAHLVPILVKGSDESETSVKYKFFREITVFANGRDYFFSTGKLAMYNQVQLQSDVEKELKVRALLDGCNVVYDVEYFYEIFKRKGKTHKRWGGKAKIGKLT